MAAAIAIAKKGLAATLVIGYQFTVFSFQKRQGWFAAIAAIAIAKMGLRAKGGIVVGVVVVGMGLSDKYRFIICEKCGKCEKCGEGFCADFARWETLTPLAATLRQAQSAARPLPHPASGRFRTGEGSKCGGNVKKVCRRHFCHAGGFW